MKFLWKAFILIFLTVCYSLNPPLTTAETEFTTDHNVTYDVQESGLTKVTQNVTITNNTPTFFVSSYKLDISHLEIQNIKASDSQGSILDRIEENDPIINIYLKFNDKVVGKDSKLSWTLTYETNDVARKNGLVWDINVPKITPQEEITSYNVEILIPRIFGPEMFVSPKASGGEQRTDKLVYKFSKQQIQESAISATFGEFQLFYFKLKYNIKNFNLLSLKKEIALPPDVFGHQKIYYLSFSDIPESIHMDSDGNYIATYHLPTGTSKEIELTGAIKVFNRKINIDDGGNVDLLPEIFVDKYTKDDKFWDTKDLNISSKALELTRDKEKVTEKAYEIYKFVAENFSYNYDRVGSRYSERLGATKAINNPENSICTEFTDVAVALLRAAGIPARELNGFGYTLDEQLRPLSVYFEKSSDILHSWLEFYDPNLGWIPIDPTWANTSAADYFSRMDTNHIVFVRKGSSSILPLPAGAYKLGNEKERQVEITLTTDIPEDYSQIGAEYLSKSVFDLIRKKRNVSIKNLGNVTIFNPILQIVRNGDKVSNTIELSSLPPFAETTISLPDDENLGLIKFVDFTGRTYIEKLKIFKTSDKLVLLSRSSFLLLTGFLMPLLYTILILLLIRLQFPQKLYYLLRRLLRSLNL